MDDNRDVNCGVDVGHDAVMVVVVISVNMEKAGLLCDGVMGMEMVLQSPKVLASTIYDRL